LSGLGIEDKPTLRVNSTEINPIRQN
jgi:hypothetical protein